MNINYPPLCLPLEGGDVLFLPPFQGEGWGGDGLRGRYDCVGRVQPIMRSLISYIEP